MSEKNPRILVVEDDPEVLRIIYSDLMNKQYEVETASTGFDALNKVESFEYAIAVVDIKLPDISGLDIMREFLDLDPDMKIIIITARYEIDNVINSMRYGAFAFIRKPFETNELEVEIRKALKERSLVFENREYHSNLEKLVEDRTSELLEKQQELELEKEKLENVLNSIGAGLQVIDSKGNILWSNPICIEWFGEDGNWQKLLQAQNPDSEISLCSVCDSFAEGKSNFHNFVLQCFDGKVREFQLSCYPVFDDAGNTIQAVKLILDVSERNKLRRELIQAEKIASIGELAAGLTHEINNPLGIILGFVQNLIDDIDSRHKYFEDLHIIEEEIFRIKKVVDQLLDFARLQERNIGNVDILRVWRRCIRFFDYLFKEKRIKVVSDVCDSSIQILGDPELLYQAFVNIVLNSIQAMPNGGDLSLKCELEIDHKSNTEYLRIEIKDTGLGIKPEDLDKVFDPFFTKKGIKGTGLGLSNTKRIIQEHSGKIELFSQAGKGTTCLITIPI